MDFKNENINLMMGDCLERIKELPDQSVDTVITDPPYGTVKGMGLDGWNKQRSSFDVKIDLNELLNEINRVLRVNGSLILFSQEPFTSELITNTHNNIPFSYRMVWKKDHFANSLIAKKAPVSYYEDICVFFKKYDSSFSHPLRSYSKNIIDFIGKGLKEINKNLGHRRVEHFFYHNTIQFEITTEKSYNELIEVYGIDKMDGFIDYKEMKRINDDFKSPKIFNLPENKKYKSNILEYKKDYNGYHPTQKPVALMEDLVYTYTNEGMTVLDFTMGSGSTGVACQNLNRKFIGIEKDEGYFNIAKERIKKILTTILKPDIIKEKGF